MNDAPPPTANPAQLALELYNLLAPHSSEIRQRVIQSALASLGEGFTPSKSTAAGSGNGSAFAGDSGDLEELGPKAVKWAQKNGVTRAMLDEIFHITNGNVETTASSVPGAGKRDMTVNCYLLTGLRGLLATDASTLDDSETIALCKRLTAYDKNNHPAYRKGVGNMMSGAKPTFTLTGPGETAAGNLVKQMAASKG